MLGPGLASHSLPLHSHAHCLPHHPEISPGHFLPPTHVTPHPWEGLTSITHLLWGLMQHRETSATPCASFPSSLDGTDMPYNGTIAISLGWHKGLLLAHVYLRIVPLICGNKTRGDLSPSLSYDKLICHTASPKLNMGGESMVSFGYWSINDYISVVKDKHLFKLGLIKY